MRLAKLSVLVPPNKRASTPELYVYINPDYVVAVQNGFFNEAERPDDPEYPGTIVLTTTETFHVAEDATTVTQRLYQTSDAA